MTVLSQSDDIIKTFTTTVRIGKADAQDAALTVHAGIGAWVKSTATYTDFNHHSVKFQLVGTEDYFVNDEDGNAVKVVAKEPAFARISYWNQGIRRI